MKRACFSLLEQSPPPAFAPCLVKIAVHYCETPFNDANSVDCAANSDETLIVEADPNTLDNHVFAGQTALEVANQSKK